jgi:hypothetical protein
MGRQMPWDEIPDSNVFPTGSYQVIGVKLEEVFSNNGKLMYAMDVAVVEHPRTTPYTNMHYFENFVIGSDDDPEANVSGTWVQSVGAKRMKQMLNAAQIAEKADMDKICAGFTGTQFVLGLLAYKEKEKNRDGSPNEYAGIERNRSTGFYKIGAKGPGIDETKPTGGVAAVAQQPPPAPAAVAAAAPAQAPPTPGPAPATAAAAPNPAPQPAQGGQMFQCNQCGQQVPAAEFAGHLQACLAAQAK